MAYSAILLKLWGIIPKWLYLLPLVYFYAYNSGINEGREPYRTAEKIADAKQVLIVRYTKQDMITIYKKGLKASENTKNNECVISDSDARELSDITIK